MNTLLLVVAVITSLSACFVSCFHAWLEYKKTKEKDEIWEACVRMICAKDYPDADEFVRLYAQLRFAKENPYAIIGFTTIEEAMKAKEQADKETLFRSE